MKSAILIVAVILLIRLPFLNQAVQGDDVYYIAAAEHAQIDPLHPNHTHYLFQGRDVDFRGYPHPPLNAWYLAALIAVVGEIREVPFHAAYIVFSLISALAMYSVARRFSPHPLWATLLFIVVPAFVINGNSFESDIPFLAFWMAGIAAFIHGDDRNSKKLLALSAACLAIASLAALQVVFAIPILAMYSGRRRWLVLAAPLVAIATWQTFEFLTSGQFPFAIAAGYQQSYGYQRIAAKLRNATSLSVHLLYLLSPLALVPFFRTSRNRNDARFLIAWIATFFLGSILVFPAGSARYLLPLAAPVVILISRLPSPMLATLFTLQLALSLVLATVNYQHWDAYRQFAQSLTQVAQHNHVWVNADWSLRYYMELEGGRPIHQNQFIHPGALIVSSELALPVQYSHGGSTLVSIATREIRPSIPLRLIGLETRSAYSDNSKGFFPFGISRSLIDRVHADILQARIPTRENISMNAPDADDQILTGIYPREQQPWRWMSRQSSIVLKTPTSPTPIHISLYIPDAVPARTVTISLDNKLVLTRTFPAPGLYTIVTDPQHPSSSTAVLTIDVDKTISTAEDQRQLGIILTEAGFAK